MATAKKFNLPKSLAACGDLLYETRQQRLDLQKVVDELQAQESLIREHLIDNLPKSEATGVAGKLCRVTVNTKVVPQVEDWDKFYAYVKRTGSFDLLGKRLIASAVEARWENKKDVPGVAKFNAVTLSVNKV